MSMLVSLNVLLLFLCVFENTEEDHDHDLRQCCSGRSCRVAAWNVCPGLIIIIAH